MKSFYLFIFLFIAIVEYTQAQQQWYLTSVPRGRHVNSLEFLGPEDILFGGGNEFNSSLQDIWLSHNKSLEWELVNNIAGQPWIKSMAFIDTLQGFAVGDSGTIFKTVNGARFWTEIPKPIIREFSKIIYASPQTLFIVGGTIPYKVIPFQTVLDTLQTIVKSTDGGNTWNVVLDRKGFWLNGVDFTDTLHGIAVGDKGVILKTVNGGGNWSTITPPVVRNFKSVKFISSTVGYIVGGVNYKDPFTLITTDSFSTILRTTDGGASWSVLKDDLNGILNDITFTDDNIGYIVGDRTTLLKTTNAGLNWSPMVIPNATPDITFNCVEFKGNDLGMIGGQSGVLCVYTTSLLPSIYVLGTGYKGPGNYSLIGGIDTHGETATYDFYYSIDSTFATISSPFYLPQDIKSDSGNIVAAQAELSGLIPDTTYYFFMVGRTLAGYSFSNRFELSTKMPKYQFQTLPPTDITTFSATLKGLIDKFPDTADLSFEYGTSPIFGKEIVAIPGMVNDTFSHSVYGLLDSLLSDQTYYFRLKGVHNEKTYYGDIQTLVTANAFHTQPATDVTTISAVLNGSVDKLRSMTSVSFQYGESPFFGKEISAIPAIINDTFPHSVSASVIDLDSNKTYYYRVKGQGNDRSYYGELQTFFTGKLFETFQTLPPTDAVDSSVVLNGYIDHSRLPVDLIFEYGPTINLGNSTPAIPSYVNDTLPHYVSSAISGLIPNRLYYYRLRGQTNAGTIYGNVLAFQSSYGNGVFNTTVASNITNSSAQLNGNAKALLSPVSLSFEYGSTPALGNIITANPSSISDTLFHNISANISGLVPGNIYYFRLKVVSHGIPIYGEIRQFYPGYPEIPNWDFQDWETDTVSIPKSWNIISDDFERVPGHNGNYAIKIFGQTLFLNGVAGDGGLGIFGGVPLNVVTRPDSVILFSNYYVETGDTAVMLVFLSKQSRPLSLGFYPIIGNTNGTFKRIAYKILYDSIAVPDSVIIGFVTTNALDKISNFNNNFLVLDDISFLPGNITFENSGFEDWFTSIIEKPLGWFNLRYIGLDTLDPKNNHMVSKVYFDPPGDYAAQVRNVKWLPWLTIAGNMANTQDVLLDGVGGFPLRGKHYTLNGYYKYFPVLSDSMYISIKMKKGGTDVGFGLFTQKDSVPEFTSFSIPITYINDTDIPDTGVISIASGTGDVHDGTKLIIDKLSFDGFTVGLPKNNKPEGFEAEGLKVYPNPARDHLVIEDLSPGNEECIILLMRINGQVVRELKLNRNQKQAQIETGDLIAGNYILVLKKGDKIFSKKVIIL